MIALYEVLATIGILALATWLDIGLIYIARMISLKRNKGIEQ